MVVLHIVVASIDWLDWSRICVWSIEQKIKRAGEGGGRSREKKRIRLIIYRLCWLTGNELRGLNVLDRKTGASLSFSSFFPLLLFRFFDIARLYWKSSRKSAKTSAAFHFYWYRAIERATSPHRHTHSVCWLRYKNFTLTLFLSTGALFYFLISFYRCSRSGKKISPMSDEVAQHIRICQREKKKS